MQEWNLDLTRTIAIIMYMNFFFNLEQILSPLFPLPQQIPTDHSK